MADDVEKIEKEKRAKRLVEARKFAKFSGPTPVAKALGMKVDTYKAYEQGRNGFGIADAKAFAKLFKVSLNWLNFGTGDMLDEDEPSQAVTVENVPIVSMVSAGALAEVATLRDLSEYPTRPAVNLPQGIWVSMRVEGNSMNKISPPDSIIFVNLADKRLVHNACYIIADETGSATYKRYRQNANPPFQPASYDDVPAPRPEGEVRIIGRVYRSTIDM
ncbi:MAG: S24 family peptidase [Mesorhizobium sp.]